MATSSSDFTCPICLQEYNAPKLLPCLHSICQHCLEKCIENPTVSEEKLYQFQCPVCTKAVTKPSDLPVEKRAGHFPANSILLPLLTEAKTKVDQLCDPCLYEGTSIAATSYCSTCKEALCKVCDSAHRKSRATREHTFLTLDETGDPLVVTSLAEGITCTYHFNKDVEFYCASHDSVCCSDCVVDYHRGCNEILKLEQHAENLCKAEAPLMMTERIKQLERDLCKYVTASNETLQKLETSTENMTIEIDKLIVTLQEAKSKISMEREGLLKDESHKKHNISQECQSLKTSMKDSIKLIDSVVKYDNKHHSLVILQKFKEQLAYSEKIIHDKYSDVRQVEARLQVNKHFISLRKLTDDLIAKIEINENKLKNCLPLWQNYAVTSDPIPAMTDEGLPCTPTTSAHLAPDEDENDAVENASDFLGQDIRASGVSCNHSLIKVESKDGDNESIVPIRTKGTAVITTADCTAKYFPKEIYQQPQCSQDKRQSEKMRPENTDGGIGNHTISDPKEMCQVAYFQDMGPQSELLISKMIDHGKDYTPLQSEFISKGITKEKYTTDTSHHDSQDDMTKDRMQTKTAYQKHGPIILTSRRNRDPLVSLSVNKEVFNEDRDNQNNKGCEHVENLHKLPCTPSKEKVPSEEGQTNTCHSQLYPSTAVEYLDYAMKDLNIDDKHTNSQSENSVKEKPVVAWSHGRPSVHNEKPHLPLMKPPLEDDVERLYLVDSKDYANMMEANNDYVVQSVMEKQIREPFYLEKMKLTAEEYVPTPPDPFRLFLKNISTKVTHDLLILYLESRCNVAPAEILFGRLPGTALVTFSEAPDVELLLKKVKERPLEGQNIQVIRVPVTSSIQLSGLSLSTTRDTIQFYFENSKRSGGGPVADVKLAREKQSCIVSFKDSEDAERVCMMPHTIDKKDIEVCLYYECLDDDMEAEESSDFTHKTKDTVDEFKLPDPVELKDMNPQILRFLLKNEKHRQIFEKNLSDVNGVAKWPSSVEGYVIIECTVKVEDKSASSVLKDWSSRVVDRVNSFAAGIEVVKFNPMQMVWSRVIERLQTATIDNPEDLGVSVEQEKNDITVAGPKAAVEKLQNTIQDIIAKVETQIELEKQRVTKTKSMKKYEMTLLRETHFKQNIENIFPGLQFDLNQKDNMAVFTGQADIVWKAFVQMHKKCWSFASISMPMSKASKDLLFIKEVTDYINQKMKSQKIIGVWDIIHREEVRMFGQDEKEVQKAIQLVRNCLLEKEILLDEIKAGAIQGQQWSQLVQGMQEKHTRKVVIETSMRSILIVAVDDIFQDVFDEINIYLEKHSVEEIFLTLDPMRVKFIERCKNEDIKALENKFASSHVKLCVIDHGDKKGIKINGRRDVCSIVKTELAKMANTVFMKEHRIVSKDGLKEFLQGYRWANKQILIEKRFKCFVVMKDSGTSSSLEQEGASGGYSSKREGNADQRCEPMEWQPSTDSGHVSIDVWGIKVSVVQGEIAKQKVDVIVNSVHQTFNLSIGAVSKSILKYGGDSIQSECRQQYHSGLNYGQVVVTSGGKLSCKQVYHGSLQIYSSVRGNSIEVMRTFVMNCLVEADKSGFKSIAFPALGTGYLRFPADEVGKLMVECIRNFGEKNVYTTLENIVLVVYPTDTNIIKAFTTVLGGTTVPSMSAQRSASSSSNISTVHGICRCTLPHSVVLEIVQGDITKETTDVIVNSVMSDLNLNQGQVSKAIFRAGGMSIQQDCQGKDADFKKHGFIVTHSGMLPCKKIIHMASQDKDHKWKDIIKRVLIATEQSGDRSISFPALGTGGKGLSPKKIAQVMYSACTEFAKSLPVWLKNIRVVLFQEAMLTKFVKAISVHSSGQGESPVSSTPVAGKHSTRESKQISVVFSITADSEVNVQKAIKDMERFIKLHSFLEGK